MRAGESRGVFTLRNLDIVAEMEPVYEYVHDLIESLTHVYENHEHYEGAQLALYELFENAVKYSASNPPEKIRFSFRVNHLQSCIMIRNKCVSIENISALTRAIDEINMSPEGDTLYQARMRELFENPYQDRVRLGLLRIVVEAGFRLRYLKSKKFIEVIAIKKNQLRGGE
jgi:hypothetical protein